MIDHIYLPVTNIKRSLDFYSALLTPLGTADRWKFEAKARLKLATPICGGLEGPSRDFGSKNLTHPSPRSMSLSPRSASRQSMKPSTQR